MKTKIGIVGPKHVGKSTVGKKLAKELNLLFIDLDDKLLNLYNTQNNKNKKNIRELYNDIGEKNFRNYEVHAIQNLPHKYVLALGGGAADNKKLWEELQDTFIIALDINSEIAWQRIIYASPLTLPAFLCNSTDPQTTFEDIFERRMRIYIKNSHYVCNTRKKTLHEIVKLCLQTIKN